MKFGIKQLPLWTVLMYWAVAYVVYFVARMAYLLVNWSYFAPALTASGMGDLLRGALLFDTSAIMLTSIPVVVLVLLTPWQRLARWGVVVINGAALAVGLCDAVYFRFTMRRTTTTVFTEFQNEQNLGGIFLHETLTHWYLVVLFVMVIWLMSRVLRMAHGHGWSVVARVLSLAVLAPFIVAGIRGGFTTAVRPITISNANQYVSRPIDAALVLNTPFSLYRTIGKAVFVRPDYYTDEAELASIYEPITRYPSVTTHHPPPNTQAPSPNTPKNVVVIIVESFGREYIGALNRTLEGGQYQGYTPFVDSLVSQSVSFKYSYCNGRKSIDGMPSILSSVPMFVEPFILTPQSMNNLTGIAGILKDEGYQTAFFHGAQRGSMGFQAFARKTGFDAYYGREDFNRDPRYGGDRDFDGTWAIWDEPFLQYYATKMSELKQPFMTAVFTASSHHPYVVPEAYRDTFPEEGIKIHKCIRYTDHALRRFFQTASQQPWFRNTIFVLTSDHTNLSDHAYYQTDLGGFCSPIIIYTPDGQLTPRIEDKVAQQIDILPTLMGLLGHRQPTFGFGIDVLNTAADSTWAVNYLNGIYQYVKHGYVLQFDGQRTRAVYALDDSLMQHNVAGRVAQQPQMERELQAIIQQYMNRMLDDRLQVE